MFKRRGIRTRACLINRLGRQNAQILVDFGGGGRRLAAARQGRQRQKTQNMDVLTTNWIFQTRPREIKKRLPY